MLSVPSLCACHVGGKKYNMYPILKYPGAKWRIAPWILSFMPPHESYLEPFCGSCAVFLNKPKSRIETINDMDGEIVNFFYVCRNRPDELATALRLTPWARSEREAAFAPAGDELEQARRFAVRCWQTFGAGRHKSQGWRHSTGAKENGGPDNPKLWSRLPDAVMDASIRLLEAQIEKRPALELIQRFNGSGVLIYADPPYLRDTRTAHGDAYNHEMSEWMAKRNFSNNCGVWRKTGRVPLDEFFSYGSYQIGTVFTRYG